jgi:hypothetical protein
MGKLEAYGRLRRAAELLIREEIPEADSAHLLQAWDLLKGLRDDDFPVELQPTFSFLQHEISRAHCEALSAREVSFLSDKIRKLESAWNEIAAKALHNPG